MSRIGFLQRVSVRGSYKGLYHRDLYHRGLTLDVQVPSRFLHAIYKGSIFGFFKKGPESLAMGRGDTSIQKPCGIM